MHVIPGPVKLLTALSVVLLAFVSTLHAGYLTTEAEAMFAGAQDGEMFYAIAFMKERPDIEGYRFVVEGLPRKDRTRLVWDLVHELAERSQQNILEHLDNQFRAGNVVSFRSLEILNAVGVHATEEVIRELATRSDVAHVIPDIPRSVWDNATGVPVTNLDELDEIVWSVAMSNAPDVWDLGYTGEGILVSVIDTGVNYNHGDFADHLWDGGDEYPHHGYDFGEHDNDPCNDIGRHGTSVSGVLCGDGTEGSSTGIAPDATLMCLRVGGSLSHTSQQEILDALDFSLEHEVDITNLSMGFPIEFEPARTEWRQTYDILDAAGIISVTSAGNRGDFLPPYCVTTPGDIPSPWQHPDELGEGERSGMISVGATDSLDVYAFFSSHGPCTWEDVDEYGDWVYNNNAEPGLIKPDIVAPGDDIITCHVDGGYERAGGTSMSSPYIAGVCALILSKNDALLPVQVDSILQNSVIDLGDPGKDNFYGVGRIMCDSAIAHTPAMLGWLQGRVVDGNTGEPLDSVHITLPGTMIETWTTETGHYRLSLLHGIYTVEFSLHPYNDLIEESVTIGYQDTTTLNAALCCGLFSVDVESLLVALDEEQTTREEFTITNEGNADLDFSMHLLPPFQQEEFLDSIFSINMNELIGDTILNGAAYGQGVFYITCPVLILVDSFWRKSCQDQDYGLLLHARSRSTARVLSVWLLPSMKAGGPRKK